MANPIVQQINAELSELQKELAKFKDTVDYLNGAKTAVKDAVVKVNHSEAHFNKKVEELKATYNSIIGLSDAVSSVMKKLNTINFPERLDNIEKTIKYTIDTLDETKIQTIDEVKKASEAIINIDFENKFRELNEIVNISVQSCVQLVKVIEDQNFGEKLLALKKDFSEEILNSFKEIEKNYKKIAFDTVKMINDLNLPIRIDKLDANISGILNATQNLQGRLDIIERNVIDRVKIIQEEQNKMSSELSLELKLQNTKLTTLTRNWEEWSKLKDEEIKQIAKNASHTKNLLLGGLFFILLYLFFKLVR